MKTVRLAAIVLPILVLASTGTSRSQDSRAHPLDRVFSAKSGVVTGPGLASTTIRTFQELAVSVGFEEADALANSIPRSSWLVPQRLFDIGGLTVRAALDKIVAANPRYEWRFVDGVVLVRPRDAWTNSAHPLLRRVPAVELRDARGVQVTDAINEALGHVEFNNGNFKSLHVFSMTFGGGALIDLLNAVAVAHGDLGWMLKAEAQGPVGDKDRTVAVRPALWIVTPVGVPVEVPRAFAEADVAVPSVVQVSGGGLSDRPPRPSLDEPIRSGVTVTGLDDAIRFVGELLQPFGFEEVDALTESVSEPFRYSGPPQTKGRTIPLEYRLFVEGRTPRQLLDLIVASDPRYQWREIDGVILLRPISSWESTRHPLGAVVPPVSLRDVRVFEALQTVFDALVQSPRGQGFWRITMNSGFPWSLPAEPSSISSTRLSAATARCPGASSPPPTS